MPEQDKNTSKKKTEDISSSSGSGTIFEDHVEAAKPLSGEQAKLRTMFTSFEPSKNPLASFCVFPDVKFSTQEEGEEIILLLRRHPATNILWIIIAIILILLPIIGLPLFDLGGVLSILDRISTGLLPALLAFWYLAVIGYILLNFFFWYFNVNIVTNRRVLDFDFPLLLYREFSEALLEKIEDVTSKGGGIFSVIFNLGDVHVQTAGTLTNIEFLSVPRPQQVVRIITNLVEAKLGGSL